MTPCQPYILRAIRQWIEDNGMTPCISVKGELFNEYSEQQYAEDELITFDISSQATKDFVVDADGLSFKACSEIADVPIAVPTEAVVSIFAEEDPSTTVLLLQQMSFEAEAELSRELSSTTKASKKPHLRIVE